MMRYFFLLSILSLSPLFLSAEDETPSNEAQPPPAETPLSERRGVVEKVKMTDCYYKSFRSAVGGNLPKALFTTQWWERGKAVQHKAADKDYAEKIIGAGAFPSLDEEFAYLYIPPEYDGSKPYGLFIHLSGGGSAQKADAKWQELMTKHKLIYISPYSAYNTVTWYKCVGAGLNALATAKKNFKIDPKRIFAGGAGSCWEAASLLPCAAPKVFSGVLSVTGGLNINDMPRGYVNSEAKRLKWMFIADGGVWGYPDVKAAAEKYMEAFGNTALIDVPGEGNPVPPTAEQLEEAFTFFGGKSIPPQKASKRGDKDSKDGKQAKGKRGKK